MKSRILHTDDKYIIYIKNKLNNLYRNVESLERNLISHDLERKLKLCCNGARLKNDVIKNVKTGKCYVLIPLDLMVDINMSYRDINTYYLYGCPLLSNEILSDKFEALEVDIASNAINEEFDYVVVGQWRG